MLKVRFIPTFIVSMWRTHSCVPRSHSCERVSTTTTKRVRRGANTLRNSVRHRASPLQWRFGAHMSKSRRQFLTHASLGLLGAAAANAQEPTPGAPPAFGVGPSVGPAVSPSTFASAEKLVQVNLTAAE